MHKSWQNAIKIFVGKFGFNFTQAKKFGRGDYEFGVSVTVDLPNALDFLGSCANYINNYMFDHKF